MPLKSKLLRTLTLATLVIWQIFSPALQAIAANRYWVGTTGGNTNDSSNWSTASNACGVSTGASVPGSADIAIFDSSCTNGATINSNWTVDGIDIRAGYTGAITQATGITLTVETGDYFQNGGTFSGGDAAIDMSTAEFNLSGGTFTSTSENLTSYANWTVSGGTFNHNSGTVRFEGYGSAYPNMTVNGNTTFYNLELRNTYTGAGSSASTHSDIEILAGTTVDVDNDLTIDNDATDVGAYLEILGSGVIAVNGDVHLTTTSASVIGSSTVLINGTGNQTLNGGVVSYQDTPNIAINKTGGTLTLINSISSYEDWNYVQGNIDPGTSTVIFQGYSTGDPDLTINGDMVFYNLELKNPYTGSGSSASVQTDITITNGTNLIVNGDLLLVTDSTHISAHLELQDFGNINVRGDVNLDTATSTVHGDTTVTVDGTGNQTINGGPAAVNQNIPRLTINKTAGTLTLTDTIATFGDWNHIQGTVDAGTSTVKFRGYANGSPDATINGDMAFNDLIFHNTYTGTSSSDTFKADFEILADASLKCNGTLLFISEATGSAPSVLLNTGTLEVRGDINIDNDSGHAGGSATLLINGTGNQTLNGGTADSFRDICNVTINKTAGTLTLINDLSTFSDWNYVQGAIDHGTSTVRFSGYANTDPDLTINGDMPFYNLHIENPYTSGSASPVFDTDIVISTGTTITANGSLYITNDASSTDPHLIINTGTVSARGNVTVDPSSSDIDGSAALHFTGSNDQIFDLSVGPDDLNLSSPMIVNKTGGTVSLASALTLDLIGQDLTIQEGRFDINGNNLLVIDTLTIEDNGNFLLDGDESVTYSTFTIQSGSTITYKGSGGPYSINNAWAYDSLAFNGTGAQFSLPANESTAANLNVYNGIFDINGYDLTVTGNFNVYDSFKFHSDETLNKDPTLYPGSTVIYSGTTGPYTVNGSWAYTNLIINGSGAVFTLDKTMDVNGNLSIYNGTFNGSSFTITLNGNWLNSATFAASSSTVNLDGTSQTLTGSTTFNNLVKHEGANDSADEVLTFDNTATFTINGTLTFNGRDFNDRINLVSDSPGTQWNIHPQTTWTVNFVDVADSVNDNSTYIYPADSVNSGNNVNWFDDVSSWSKLRITIDADKVNGDVYQFPVYIDLADLNGTNFFANVQADGDDIRVTLNDQNSTLATELVSIDTTTNAGELWFKAPFLSSTVNSEFWLFYGNGTAAAYAADHAYGRENVWTEGYVAVWHLGENGNTTDNGYLDSTSYDNDGNGVSMTASSDIAGKIGSAQNFDGGADYIAVGDDSSLNNLSAATISYWVNLDNNSALYVPISKDGDSGYHNQISSSGQLSLRHGTATGAVGSIGDIVATNWIYTVSKFNGSDLNGYTNGSLLATTLSGTAPSGMDDDLWIGAYSTNGSAAPTGNYIDGSLDEIHIANIDRTAQWIMTEYNNQNSASTFYTAESFITAQHYSPATGAVGIDRKQGLILTFDTTVQKGTGDIRIKRYSDDNLVETIDVTSGSVTVSGDKVLIKISNILQANTEFYVEVDSGAITDMASNSFLGISNKDTWKFTSAMYNNIFL